MLSSMDGQWEINIKSKDQMLHLAGCNAVGGSEAFLRTQLTAASGPRDLVGTPGGATRVRQLRVLQKRSDESILTTADGDQVTVVRNAHGRLSVKHQLADAIDVEFSKRFIAW